MNQDMEIVPLNEKPDYAAILACWSFMEWYRNRTIPFDINLKAYQERSRSLSVPRSFVALYKTMPVGMVSLKENDLWSRKDLNPWLASLFVHKEYRHLGIGGHLVDRVIHEAEMQNYSRMYLFLGHNEERDLGAWYRSMGWVFYESALDNDGFGTDIYCYEIDPGVDER